MRSWPGHWFLFLLLYAAPCYAQITPFTGKVVSISDGDTFTVLDSKKAPHKIRLAAIDAPETGQPFADEAKKHLSELIFDQNVMVFSTKADRDGPQVSQVFLYGKEISLEMIRAGFAWHFKEYEKDQPEKERVVFAGAEIEARKAKLGLWADPDPTAPWQYRKKQASSNRITDAAVPVLSIIGDRNSKVYHWDPGCPDLFRVAERSRVKFKSKEEAEAAGYRPAKNCR